MKVYFIPKVDTTCDGHCFRELPQAAEETIRQFPTRLRRAAIVTTEKTRTIKSAVKSLASAQVRTSS